MAYYTEALIGKPVIQFSTSSGPMYLFGFRDMHTAPFQFAISNIAVSSNVVTANGNLFSGGGGFDPNTGKPPVPVANATISVRGASTANVNVDPTAATTANINGITGSGTISWSAPNSGNANLVADGGVIVVQPFTYPDVLKVGASIEVGQKFSPDTNDSSRSFFVDVFFPQSPINCNVVLQGASFDTDSAFSNLVAKNGSYIAGQVVGNVQTIRGQEYNFSIAKFIRLAVIDATSNANTTSTIIGSVFGG